MDTVLEEFRQRVDILRSGCEFSPITKGFSMEQKYLVTTEFGDKMLLRVMPVDHYDRKQTEFGIIQAMYQSKVRVPKPIAIGKFEDLNTCYYVLSFIEGLDAEESLRGFSSDVQFNIGVEAGNELRMMHECVAPNDIAPWQARILKKCRAYVDAYKEIGVKVRRAEKVIKFIEQNVAYLEGRPNRFQHDDFHVGNIIVNNGNYAGVIDFNRFDWGDPIHDFLKVGFFSSQVSVPFSLGQLHGYFQGKSIPEGFWTLYNVYVAMTVFSSVVWTIRVVPDTIENMMERINRVLDEHGYFDYATPSWFKVLTDY